MKKWIILAVVLAGGAWGFHKWRMSLPGTSSSASDPHPATAVVETRDIHFSVSAAGEIGPADQVSVRPEINGKILTLPVESGEIAVGESETGLRALQAALRGQTHFSGAVRRHTNAI